VSLSLVRGARRASRSGNAALLALVVAALSAGCPKKAAQPIPTVPAQEVQDPSATPTGDSAGGDATTPPSPAPDPVELSPRLLPRHPEEGVKREELEEYLTGADELMASVRGRPLSQEQRRQAEAAESFLAQARDALKEEDLERCSFLVEKSVVLLQEIELNSRP
jgi:hypothetical protein